MIRYNSSVYTYNANGELLTKAVKVQNNYQTTDYSYDAFGQLRKAGNVTYGTSLLNRRIAKTVDGIVQRYYTYTPEGQLIGELDSNMNLVKTFIYASKSHVPDYFIDQNGNSFKIITDHLGSVRFVVDAISGEIVQKMHHDEFGKVLVDTNPNATPFGFAGGLYDFETGLVRFGARDYDPHAGRWTAKDPIRFSGGDENLYGYVLQDPVNLIDPIGKSAIDVARMRRRFIETEERMSREGMRRPGSGLINGIINNIESSIFGKKLGCGEQAQVVLDDIVADVYKNGAFDDHWQFKIVNPNPFHQNIEATSSNPSDPKVTIDPWANTFTP